MNSSNKDEIQKNSFGRRYHLCCRKVNVLEGKSSYFIPQFLPKGLLPGLRRHKGQVDDLIQYLSSGFLKQLVPVELPDPGEVVLPLGLQVEPSCLKSVGLLLHSVSHLKAKSVSPKDFNEAHTIFQKHSDTAKLRLRVVIWLELMMPPLKILLEAKNCSS